MQSCQMGLLIKIIVQYDQPHWRQAGYSGELVTSGHPLCITFDDSHEASPALVTFLGGREAVLWAGRSEKELKAAVVEQLGECFGDWAYDYTNIIVKNWASHPFIGGSPVTLPGVGWMFLLPALRETHHRIHFAGTETATAWLGYMEGAVQSGVRAGLEVLNNIKPQCLSPLELKVRIQRALTSLSTVGVQVLQQYAAPVRTLDNHSPLYKQLSLLLLLSLTGVAFLFRLRSKYSHCFIPFR